MVYMPTLSFTVGPEGVVRIHDAVLCLAKFSDTVGLEARSDGVGLIFSALNSSRSASASFSLDKDAFFQTFQFNPGTSIGRIPENDDSNFTCQLYNKALLSVFRGRLDVPREREASIERCEVTIQDRPDKTECRLVVKMICGHGVKKTYRLTYESSEVVYAVFDQSISKNHWSIDAHVLKSFGEYFGFKTEQLDIYYEADRVTFTSYTEKIVDGSEILRQPLQTSITLDRLDFDNFMVEEKLHIGITVRDFKAIVTHGETFKTSVTACYSYPSRPMQLSYNAHGMKCEFTLMTIGEYRGGSVTPVPSVPRNASAGSLVRPEPSKPFQQPESQQRQDSMAPPLQPASRSFGRESASQRHPRPSPPPPRASIDHQSLFIPEDDDESRWGEKTYDDDEDQLGWGASADNDSYATSLHGNSASRVITARSRLTDNYDDADRRVPPTQSISQIQGIFDNGF
ncbi:hypothetical protein MMC26_000649 [Xylographa opegraphella]|nr:hypothetical protein [Xylographa opegraphella]